MHTIALVLACFSSAGHGLRMLNSIERFQSGLDAGRVKSLRVVNAIPSPQSLARGSEQVSAKGTLNTLSAFQRLLLALKPAAAFMYSGQRARFPMGNPARDISRSAVLDNDVDGSIPVAKSLAAHDPMEITWRDFCKSTGIFTSSAGCMKHIKSGANNIRKSGNPAAVMSLPIQLKFKTAAKCRQRPPCCCASGDAEPESLWDLPRDTVGNPLALLLLAQLVLFTGVGAVIPTIALYGKAIGLSSASNGLFLSAPAVALALLARPAGGYADQGRKPAMLFGMACIVVADLGTAFANSLATLLLARLGLGAGRCLSECGERGYLADLASRAPSLRGELAAAQQAISALGIAIGAPLGGLAVESYGPPAAFLCVSAAAALTCALYAALPETTQKNPASTLSNGRANDREDGNNVNEGWAALLQAERWRGLAFCEAGARFGFAAKIASVPVIAAAVLPGGAIAAGSLLSAAGLAGLAGAPLGGWLSDQRGSRFTAVASGIASGVSLMLVPLALTAPLGELLGPSTNGLAFGALILLWSVAVAAQGPALTAVGQEMAPKGAEATALAFPRAVGDAVYIVAPFVLGLVADANPGFGIECALAGVASLAGAIALAILSGGPSTNE